jgi:hypothetical protein
VPGLIAIVGVYLLIGDAVSTTRNRFGPDDTVSVGERVELLTDAFSHPDSAKADQKYYSWARFSYTPPQAAAVVLYDSGRGDDDFELLGWSLLPRFLFPEKPVMSAGGREFHIKVTGFDNSSSGHGVFINGYYNAGWGGLIFVSVFLGCILACTSAFAAAVFRARVVIWLPIALLGSFMAFRIDGSFLSDCWGPSILFALAVAVGGFIDRGEMPTIRKR